MTINEFSGIILDALGCIIAALGVIAGVILGNGFFDRFWK